MPYCHHCRTRVNPQAAYCPLCGRELAQSSRPGWDRASRFLSPCLWVGLVYVSAKYPVIANAERELVGLLKLVMFGLLFVLALPILERMRARWLPLPVFFVSLLGVTLGIVYRITSSLVPNTHETIVMLVLASLHAGYLLNSKPTRLLQASNASKALDAPPDTKTQTHSEACREIQDLKAEIQTLDGLRVIESATSTFNERTADRCRLLDEALANRKASLATACWVLFISDSDRWLRNVETVLKESFQTLKLAGNPAAELTQTEKILEAISRCQANGKRLLDDHAEQLPSPTFAQRSYRAVENALEFLGTTKENLHDRRVLAAVGNSALPMPHFLLPEHTWGSEVINEWTLGTEKLAAIPQCLEDDYWKIRGQLKLISDQAS